MSKDSIKSPKDNKYKVYIPPNKKVKAYVASPYTNGITSENVRLQLDAHHILMDSNNIVPFSPLLSHFLEIHKHRNDEDWLKWDLEWLEVCDILIRFKPVDENGNEVTSNGADIEEETAKKLKIPIYIFKDLKELKFWLGIEPQMKQRT